jgi:hypothetical protein
MECESNKTRDKAADHTFRVGGNSDVAELEVRGIS